jgi:hypothetical protein
MDESFSLSPSRCLQDLKLAAMKKKLHQCGWKGSDFIRITRAFWQWSNDAESIFA